MGIVSAPSERTPDNCENELIHIPGQVQGHGALLAFLPNGVLGWASANAGLVPAVNLPEFGRALHSQHCDGQSAVHDAVAYKPAEPAEPPGATSLPRLDDVVLAGVAFDLIVHRCDKAVVAELERHMPAVSRPAPFAVRAQRVMA